MKNYNQKYLLQIFTLFVLLFSSINSFAVLPLPSSLIAFDSPQGQQIFADATYKQDYSPLKQYFHTQINKHYCGVASLTMVLNASGIPKPTDKPYIFTQQNFFTPNVSKIVTSAQVDTGGMTLAKLKNIAIAYGLNATSSYASSNPLAFELFKIRAKRALKSPTQFIIVNFLRAGIGEVGVGHFSPLGAYDVKTDRFLVLDVSRNKYPPVWIKARTLWQGMNTMDNTSKKHRGYIVLSYTPHA